MRLRAKQLSSADSENKYPSQHTSHRHLAVQIFLRHRQVAEQCHPSIKAPTATLMHAIVLAFMSGTARP
jgi:hypothetical protein